MLLYINSSWVLIPSVGTLTSCTTFPGSRGNYKQVSLLFEGPWATLNGEVYFWRVPGQLQMVKSIFGGSLGSFKWSCLIRNSSGASARCFAHTLCPFHPSSQFWVYFHHTLPLLVVLWWMYKKRCVKLRSLIQTCLKKLKSKNQIKSNQSLLIVNIQSIKMKIFLWDKGSRLGLVLLYIHRGELAY